MKKLYHVNYKPYSWKNDTLGVMVVASSLDKALEGAKKVMRQKGHSNGEILRGDFDRNIDKVV